MPLKQITIEIEIPDGYDFVRYGIPKEGESFLYQNGDIGVGGKDETYSCNFNIIQKKAATKTGVELIEDERKRQIESEGWIESHDDEHKRGEIAKAAICYISKSYWWFKEDFITAMWPWDEKWWKPDNKNTIRNLVKAGALIAAEIDRLQRKGTNNDNKN